MQRIQRMVAVMDRVLDRLQTGVREVGHRCFRVLKVEWYSESCSVEVIRDGREEDLESRRQEMRGELLVLRKREAEGGVFWCSGPNIERVVV